ncbi:hypothetical protein SO802_028342 [Lithocarpus litseifolius]|uniref:BURP domain-containing protein n=1 Tax=Lithocarpus litseifolius TaxID=425828 RepID=A0AAW2BR10_9ROSI
MEEGEGEGEGEDRRSEMEAWRILPMPEPWKPHSKNVKLPITGEIKLCATSLESMLDFVHSIMGLWVNLNVLTTTHPTMSTALMQNYSVLRVSKEIYAPKWVACHPLPYPCKTFSCHFIENTKIFKVLLSGENGDKVESTAVCHNTTGWDPNHIRFRQLGPKYGSTSVEVDLALSAHANARQWFEKVAIVLAYSHV